MLAKTAAAGCSNSTAAFTIQLPLSIRSHAGHIGSRWPTDAQQAYLLCIHAMPHLHQAGSCAINAASLAVDAHHAQHVHEVGCPWQGSMSDGATHN